MAEDGRDMFLKVTTASKGAIKGESADEKHVGEIDVLGWSWGMHAGSSMSARGGGRATMNELHVQKSVDSASVALMQALRNNDVIKKAELTVRKAGKTQHEYFKITIEDGRLTSMDVATADNEPVPTIAEKLSFSFQKISVEYVPQGPDGQPRGGMVFATETAAN
jgi:type VI secretion system secreted protein Hcp